MDLLTPTFPSLSAPQVVYSICSILQHLLYIVHIQYITVPAVVMLCIKEKQKSQIAALRVALGYIWSFNFTHSQKVESRASIALVLYVLPRSRGNTCSSHVTAVTVHSSPPTSAKQRPDLIKKSREWCECV